MARKDYRTMQRPVCPKCGIWTYMTREFGSEDWECTKCSIEKIKQSHSNQVDSEILKELEYLEGKIEFIPDCGRRLVLKKDFRYGQLCSREKCNNLLRSTIFSVGDRDFCSKRCAELFLLKEMFHAQQQRDVAIKLALPKSE
jgi:ribosomal protein L37AE/L43A